MSASEFLILQSASRLLKEKCTIAELAEADVGVWPQRLWDAIEEFGLPVALVDEAHGGFGIPVVEAFAVIRVAAEVPAPLPLAETMVANRLLGLAGLGLITGPATIDASAELVLSRTQDGWRLTGVARYVPWGRSASVVALGKFDGNPMVVRLGRDGFGVSQGSNIANEPRDGLIIDAFVSPDSVAPLPAGMVGDEIEAMLAAARCSQMAGAMERILEITVSYAQERYQFGRPIAKFQAIQQNLAVLAEHATAARAAAELAAEAVADFPVRRMAIAAAKVRIGEAAGIVAGIGHQVHGAIGFTQEYLLHHLTRRLWSWREEFGNEAYWSAELGRSFAKGGPQGLWAAVTAV